MHSKTSTTARGPSGTRGFFLLTLIWTWGLQGPGALAKLGVIRGDPQSYFALGGLGIFGPMLAATLCVWRQARGRGLRSLYGQLLQWRASFFWYAASLLGPPLLMAAGLFVLDPSGDRRYFYPPDQAARVVALLLIPIVEELGWRGYALPRLLRRHGTLAASMIVGAWWWAWHGAMFIVQGYSAEHFVIALLLLLSGSVVYTWLYLRSGGGLTIAILAHASAHLSNSNIAAPADNLPVVVQTTQFCLAALLLVLVDRKALRTTEPRAIVQ